MRRYWHEGNRVVRVLAVVAVLVAVGVSWASFLQTPMYEASAQLWVDWQHGDQWTNLGGSGEQIQTLEYRELPTEMIIPAIDSRPLAEEAILRLGLQMKPAELLDKLTVEQVEGSQFIRLSYEDTDPERAKQIVNTVGEVSSELISERSAAGSNLTATVWDKAAVPETPVSPRPWRNGLVTLVVGWTLIGCLAVLVHRTT